MAASAVAAHWWFVNSTKAYGSLPGSRMILHPFTAPICEKSAHRRSSDTEVSRLPTYSVRGLLSSLMFARAATDAATAAANGTFTFRTLTSWTWELAVVVSSRHSFVSFVSPVRFPAHSFPSLISLSLRLSSASYPPHGLHASHGCPRLHGYPREHDRCGDWQLTSLAVDRSQPSNIRALTRHRSVSFFLSHDRQ